MMVWCYMGDIYIVEASLLETYTNILADMCILINLFKQIQNIINDKNKIIIKSRKMINYSLIGISESVHEINMNKG